MQVTRIAMMFHSTSALLPHLSERLLAVQEVSLAPVLSHRGGAVHPICLLCAVCHPQGPQVYCAETLVAAPLAKGVPNLHSPKHTRAQHNSEH